MTITLATVRKALVAVVAVAGEALTLGLLHGTVQNIAQLVIAAAGAIGVYAVPNARGPSAAHPAAAAVVYDPPTPSPK